MLIDMSVALKVACSTTLCGSDSCADLTQTLTYTQFQKGYASCSGSGACLTSVTSDTVAAVLTGTQNVTAPVATRMSGARRSQQQHPQKQSTARGGHVPKVVGTHMTAMPIAVSAQLPPHFPSVNCQIRQ